MFGSHRESNKEFQRVEVETGNPEERKREVGGGGGRLTTLEFGGHGWKSISNGISEGKMFMLPGRVWIFSGIAHLNAWSEKKIEMQIVPPKYIKTSGL